MTESSMPRRIVLWTMTALVACSATAQTTAYFLRRDALWSAPLAPPFAGATTSTEIGPTGLDTRWDTGCLAFLPTGELLLANSRTDSFYTVDVETASVTAVAPLPSGYIWVRGMTVDDSGLLRVLFESAFDAFLTLVTVDPTTWETIAVLPLEQKWGGIETLAMVGDSMFTHREGPFAGPLLEIDLTTGELAPVAGVAADSPKGLDYDPRVGLWALGAYDCLAGICIQTETWFDSIDAESGEHLERIESGVPISTGGEVFGLALDVRGGGITAVPAAGRTGTLLMVLLIAVLGIRRALR